MHKTSIGEVREGGKWVKPDLSKVGMVANESLQSTASCLMHDLSDRAARGVNIGGQGLVKFEAEDGNFKIDIGGGNMSHYLLVQSRVAREVRVGFRLPVDWVMWTSSVSRDEDPNATRRVVGPEVVGRALATTIPRWFNYTFRIEGEPARGTTPGAHVIYLSNYIDRQAGGNAVGLCNVRLPLDAPPLKKVEVRPANLVEALNIAQEGQRIALNKVKSRLKKS